MPRWRNCRRWSELLTRRGEGDTVRVPRTLSPHPLRENCMSALPEDFDRWLSAARDGSRDALGRVLEACRRYLLFVARHELNEDLQAKGGASDLVQETFLEGQC